jgi:hypothetical protein
VDGAGINCCCQLWRVPLQPRHDVSPRGGRAVESDCQCSCVQHCLAWRLLHDAVGGIQLLSQPAHCQAQLALGYLHLHLQPVCSLITVLPLLQHMVVLLLQLPDALLKQLHPLALLVLSVRHHPHAGLQPLL